MHKHNDINTVYSFLIYITIQFCHSVNYIYITTYRCICYLCIFQFGVTHVNVISIGDGGQKTCRGSIYPQKWGVNRCSCKLIERKYRETKYLSKILFNITNLRDLENLTKIKLEQVGEIGIMNEIDFLR